jgi:arylsulfatase K
LNMPNILFFMTDSWDGRALGCQGLPALVRATPNADALAARGALFRNAYSSHPICCPQRANLWGGRYTHHCESWNNYKGLEPETPTFKTFLERIGYRFGSNRGGFGKHDYLSGAHTQLARVSAWTGPAGIPLPVNYRPAKPAIRETRERRFRMGDWKTLDQSVEFLRERARDGERFFLYTSLGLPHPAFLTNRHWLEKVHLDAVTIPPPDEDVHPAMKFQQRALNWTHGFDEDTVRRVRAVYYALCAEADAVLGDLLRTLDDLGLADDTIVVFSSDHGENAMEHGQWYKMNMYESSVRVPLIMAGPGIPRGQVIDNIVSTIDLFPTFMDIAGTDAPEWLDGESLWPLATGATRASRNWAFASFTGTALNTTAWMFRRGPWKYIAYPGFPPELFNVQEDPGELRNLSDDAPAVTATMDAALRDVCDYDEAHARCQAYNRSAFRQWRGEVKAHGIRMQEYGMNVETASYEQAMGNIYVGYGPAHEARLQSWLDGEETALRETDKA